MINEPYYICQISIDDSGKRFIKSEFSYWDHFNEELQKAELTQDLISGKSITINNCSILVNMKRKPSKLKQFLDIANQVLQEDFKMDCDDEFCLHRTVIADSIDIYPCLLHWCSESAFQIRFIMRVKLAEFNTKNFIAEIKRKGLVRLYPFSKFIKALKLAKDNPCDFEISKMQGKFWIHQRKFEIDTLWEKYEPQILNTIGHSDNFLRLMQISCQDKELRDRLQKIDPSNNEILRNCQTEIEKYYIKREALLRFFELQDDKSNMKEKVGLYIVQQIRKNPEKYLESEYPFIKEIAQKIRSHS